MYLKNNHFLALNYTQLGINSREHVTPAVDFHQATKAEGSMRGASLKAWLSDLSLPNASYPVVALSSTALACVCQRGSLML